MKNNIKKALLLVSSGVGGSDAEMYVSVLGSIKTALKCRMPDTDIYDAVADRRLLRSMKYEGHAQHVTGVQEALEEVKTAGYMTVYVQPLFLKPGMDTESMYEEIEARVSYGCFTGIIAGTPLPSEAGDFDKFAEDLRASGAKTPDAAAAGLAELLASQPGIKSCI